MINSMGGDHSLLDITLDQILVLRPAYGRTFNDSKDIVDYLLKDQDFIIVKSGSPVGGRYANLRDVKKHGSGIKVLILLYGDKLDKTTTFRIED